MDLNLDNIKTIKNIISSVKEIGNMNIDKIENKTAVVYYLNSTLELFKKLKNEKGVIYISNLLNKIENSNLPQEKS